MTVLLIGMNKECELAMRTFFQETLLGPVNIDNENEFPHWYPSDLIPDLRKELEHFAYPFNPNEKLNFDSLIQIINLSDTTNIAELPEGNIIIKKNENLWSVTEDGVEIAKFYDKVSIRNS